MKKFFAKLMGIREQREDFAARTFGERSAQESRDAKERHDQIMESRGDKKYVSEVIPPSSEEVTGPSDSGLKEEKLQEEEK